MSGQVVARILAILAVVSCTGLLAWLASESGGELAAAVAEGPLVLPADHDRFPQIAIETAAAPLVTIDEPVVVGQITEVMVPVAGRIVSAGSITVERADAAPFDRTLRPGDRVRKGQHLATVWSHDLGEKKSRFLAAASRLMFDEDSLRRLEQKGADKTLIDEAQRHCRTDKVSLERAEQALLELDFTHEQIEAIRHAAAQLHQARPDYSRAETWAELELQAPVDGVVVQVGALMGDNVQPGSVLVRIAEERAPQAPQRASSDEVEQVADVVAP